MALIDVRRAYLYAPARRRVFVELPPEDYQPGDEHMCGLLQYSLYGTRDAAQNWEGEFTSTLSDLKLTRGIACSCVWRGHIKVKDIVATVHGDDITVHGEWSAVELLIKMKPKRYEIKKQVIGEDPDLEKSGRILNRVIARNHDGITMADQRHSERISPRHRVPWRGRMTARESTDEDRNRPGLNTSVMTWTTVTTGTDCRRQMTMTTTAQHSQVAASRGTEHSLHESVSCRTIDQISSLHRCRCVVRWRGPPCATWNASRESDDTSSGGQKRGAGSVGSRVVSWRHTTQTLTEEAKRLPGGPCRLGSS